MPFEFRSPFSDSTPDDEPLPRELAAVGDRLRRDAQRLAERFPAPDFQQARRSARSGGPHLWLAWGAAAAVLLAMALPWLLEENTVTESAAPRRAVVSADQARLPAAEPLRQAAGPKELPVVVGGASDGPGVSQQEGVVEVPSDAFLQNVSGPELEGLLDLWEEGQGQPTSLSI